MTHIFAEESHGHSKKSLSDAIASAIKSVLGGYFGDHNIKMTVIINGFVVENDEYKVSIQVLILDPVLEREDILKETEKELERRISLSQDLTEQMIGAVYHKSIFHDDNTIDSILNDLEHSFNHDDITLIADTTFHDYLYKEYEANFKEEDELLIHPKLTYSSGQFPQKISKAA